MNSKRVVTLLALPLLAAAVSLPSFADSVNFPGSNPGTTYGNGINNSNVIVGSYDDGSGTHGFIKTGASYATVDHSGSTPLSTNLYDINNLGVIVGSGLDASNTKVGFIDNAGTFTDLFDGSTSIDPRSINDPGDVVGNYLDGSGNSFLLSGGTYTILSVAGSLGTDAEGINNSGLVVGFYAGGDGFQHGFTYLNGVYSTLDYAAGGDTELFGVSNNGEIVGGWSDGTTTHALIYNNGAFTIFDQGGVSAWTSVNDSGNVIGDAQLIMPDPSQSAVPEPGSLCLLGTGIGALAMRLRRRG